MAPVVDGYPLPDQDRLADLFLTLAAEASPSRRERGVADLVSERLRALGLHVHEDETGAAIGGDTGNLYCLVGDGDPALMMAAHMDTVEPQGAPGALPRGRRLPQPSSTPSSAGTTRPPSPPCST